MIPAATTTITVTRPSPDPGTGGGSGFEEYLTPPPGGPVTPDPGDAVVARGVRAHFHRPLFTDDPAGPAATGMRLVADPCDLRAGDAVVDAATGVSWRVQWATARPGVLGHVTAQVWEET